MNQKLWLTISDGYFWTAFRYGKVFFASAATSLCLKLGFENLIFFSLKFNQKAIKYALWKFLKNLCAKMLKMYQDNPLKANSSGGFNQTHIGLDSYYGQYEEESVICTMKGNQGLFRCASGFLETYRVGWGQHTFSIVW